MEAVSSVPPEHACREGSPWQAQEKPCRGGDSLPSAESLRIYVSIQPNSVIDSKGHGIFDPEGVVITAQAEGLVVLHKSFCTSVRGV